MLIYTVTIRKKILSSIERYEKILQKEYDDLVQLRGDPQLISYYDSRLYFYKEIQKYPGVLDVPSVYYRFLLSEDEFSEYVIFVNVCKFMGNMNLDHDLSLAKILYVDVFKGCIDKKKLNKFIQIYVYSSEMQQIIDIDLDKNLEIVPQYIKIKNDVKKFIDHIEQLKATGLKNLNDLINELQKDKEDEKINEILNLYKKVNKDDPSPKDVNSLFYKLKESNIVPQHFYFAFIKFININYEIDEYE